VRAVRRTIEAGALNPPMNDARVLACREVRLLRETPQGFRVLGKGGPFIASTATLTSNSLWTPAMLEQTTVVDAQRGGIIGVSARKLAEEQIVIAGRQVQTTRYTFITPFLR
jgi:hypothetical protein